MLYTDKGIVITMIYVDYLIIIGSDVEMIQNAKFMVNKEFYMKDLGKLRYFLSIEVAKVSHETWMIQI